MNREAEKRQSLGRGVLSDEYRAKQSAAMLGKQHALGHTHTAEHKAKNSAAHKGRVFTAEHKANISASKMGHSVSAETRAKISAAKKGNHASEATRAKLSIAHTGKNHTPEYRARMSAMRKGCKGKPMTAETKAKISSALKGYQKTAEHRKNLSVCKRGEKNPNWCGGVWHEGYAWTFNRKLRGEIRRRDDCKCQLCGVPQPECQQGLHVHHIDYDKKNSDPVNLVTLCRSCHTRTNTNRKYWTEFFQEKMLTRARQLFLF